VHIEIPDGIDVSARLDYGTGTLNYGGICDGDASDNLVYKFRVEHLPPIQLTCYLPSSYPSHQPPLFTISTEWLDKVKILSLCQMLDMIWEGQQGMEVIYQWVQWLQNSSLSHLGFSDEIILSKGDLTCDEDGEDKRACLDDSAPDVIIPRIMRYNDVKCHQAFLQDIHDCMICFSECPGKSYFSDELLVVLYTDLHFRSLELCYTLILNNDWCVLALWLYGIDLFWLDITTLRSV
jgi:E3 ubiquitin-protein ligase RNF14